MAFAYMTKNAPVTVQGPTYRPTLEDKADIGDTFNTSSVTRLVWHQDNDDNIKLFTLKQDAR